MKTAPPGLPNNTNNNNTLRVCSCAPLALNQQHGHCRELAAAVARELGVDMLRVAVLPRGTLCARALSHAICAEYELTSGVRRLRQRNGCWSTIRRARRQQSRGITSPVGWDGSLARSRRLLPCCTFTSRCQRTWGLMLGSCLGGTGLWLGAM
jgi:hypothetical protein